MKHILLTTIAAVLLVGCGESQQSAPAPETKPVEPVAEVPSQPSPPPAEVKPVEPVAEASQPEPPTAKAPDIYSSKGGVLFNKNKTGEELKAAEPVAEASKPEPPTAKAPDISIYEAAAKGNIEAVKQHLAAGTDVDAKDTSDSLGMTPLHWTALTGRREIVELLIANGADVNAKNDGGETPLDWAIDFKRIKTADLLRKHGGKTEEELKAEGK
jgi:hypothetical protein